MLRRFRLSVFSPFPLGVPHEPDREPVSSPRHVEPGRRFSRTRLSCPLLAQAYATYRRGSAFGGNQPAYST